MSEPENKDEQERDKLLLRLLKSPPQPRPKRARDKRQKSKKIRESSGDEP
jgi:hypothetical protein